MQEILTIGKTKWIYVQEPDSDIIQKLAQEYNFHEMIVEHLLESNAQSKIDINSDHFFLALTFTKYSAQEKKYLLNELNVVIGDDFILTTIPFVSESFLHFFENFKKEAIHFRESYKTSPYYILYKIIDTFYDKTLYSLSLAAKEILLLQNAIVDKKIDKNVFEDLMNQNTNKIFLKHNFLSQEDVIDDLIAYINTFHFKHLKMYFNDLKVKLSKIVNTANLLSEKTDALMNAYNTFVSIKSDETMTKLTFVNSIFLPLTVIASIGGMSEFTMMTGQENRKIAYALFVIVCIVLAWITYFILKKFFVKN